MRRAVVRTMIALLGWLIAPAVVAQIQARTTPADPGVPHLETPHGGDLERDVQIGGYTLSTFCVPQN